MTARSDVVVVGAGFAGVAAATALAERGARVRVFETRQRPGGRAYSYRDPRTGELHDNGQHVLAAFCDETIRLLDRIGTRDALATDPSFQLSLWERGRGRFDVSCPRLPAPAHWVGALARCSRFTLRDRLVALGLPARVRALLDRNGSAPPQTVAAWLASGASTENLSLVLRPLAIAALNETPEEGSASLFARVLARLLEVPAGRSGLALPRGGAGGLLSGFERYLEDREGSASYRATVLSLRSERGHARGVTLQGGESVECGAVVLAVPHDRVPWILGPDRAAPYARIAATGWSPVVSTVHTFDRAVLPTRFVGLLGTRTHWAFDRGETGPGRHQVGTVRSAAVADAARSVEAIARETLAELREAFPAAREARVLDAHVYKERHATIRATPQVQPLRPASETSIAGLYLAGDWTDTGLPPTIEGAVSSGHRAAAFIAP